MLIQIGAQPFKFGGFGQIFGPDFLIKFGGIDVIIGVGVGMRAGRRRVQRRVGFRQFGLFALLSAAMYVLRGLGRPAQ